MSQEPVGIITAQSLLPSQGDLVAKFSKIDLPKTIEMGDRGKVNVKLTNQGSTPIAGPVTVKLYTSTDETIDRAGDGKLINDCLLTSTIQQVNLLPGQSTTVRLNYGNMTSVGAPGACNLIAEITQDNNNTKQISKLVSATGSDVVLGWNATALNAIQAEGKAGRGVPPTTGSRLLAITSLSVYDAVNAFDRTRTSYAVNTDAPAGASEEAAAAAAAHRVLVKLLPNQTQLFDRQLALSLAEINDTPQAEADGVAFGNFVADTIIASRADDGWFQQQRALCSPSGRLRLAAKYRRGECRRSSRAQLGQSQALCYPQQRPICPGWFRWRTGNRSICQRIGRSPVVGRQK